MNVLNLYLPSLTRGLATSLPRHGQVKLTPTMSRMTTPISHWDAPGMGMAAHPGDDQKETFTLLALLIIGKSFLLSYCLTLVL